MYIKNRRNSLKFKVLFLYQTFGINLILLQVKVAC